MRFLLGLILTISSIFASAYINHLTGGTDFQPTFVSFVVLFVFLIGGMACVGWSAQHAVEGKEKGI